MKQPVKQRGWRHKGERAKEPFHYTHCGLDDVYLLSGYEIDETPYGEGVSIKHVDDLHRAIGLYIVKNKKDLAGKEVRFLRHQIDLTQAELAKFIGCSPQQIARYEKGECEIPGAADRMLRLLYQDHIDGSGINVHELLVALDGIDDLGVDRMTFERSNSKWREAA